MNEEKAVKNVTKRISIITNVVCFCVFAIICYVTKLDLKYAILILVAGCVVEWVIYYPIYGMLRKRMHD